MKIAYISTFYPYRGGIAQFNSLLFRELEKLGDIRAITFSRQYPDKLFPGKTQMASENDDVDKILSERLIDTINPLSWVKVGRELHRWKPDICVTKFWMPFFGPSLGWILSAANRNGSKNIGIIDNAIPHEKRPGDMMLTKYYMSKNDAFIAMSSSVENDIRKIVPEKRVYRFPHPLYDHFPKRIEKLTARSKYGIPQNKTVLLFFGFIRKYKGLDLLLEALSVLPEEYHLLIAGEPYGDFGEYDKIIKEKGLEARVTKLVRYISDNEVGDIFSASDICVLPYRSATQSGIVGIAFNYGTPILATDTGSLGEMIEPYGAGEIIPNANPHEVARALEIMCNKGLASYGEGIANYSKDYSWENLAAKIIAVASEDL